MNGVQQIVGGLLAYCFTFIHTGPLHSWQALFISYGCISVLWGVFVLIWMPDSPMRAKCFSEEDKHLLVERVRSNQTGLQNKTFRKYQFVEAFTDVQVWCYCAIMAGTTLPTSGLGAFANIIITGFDFTILQTQLLGMPLYPTSLAQPLTLYSHGPRFLYHNRSPQLGMAGKEDKPEFGGDGGEFRNHDSILRKLT